MPFATLLRLVFQRRTDSDGCRAEALHSLSLMLSSLSPSSHHSSSHTQHSTMAEGIAPTSTGNDEVDVKLEEILSLVMACSRGEVGHDAVENALSSIVGEHTPSNSSGGGDGGAVAAASTNRIASKKNDIIIPDNGNYDEDSGDEIKATENIPADTVTKNHTTKAAAAAMAKKAAIKKKRSCAERREALEKILLGKMGERMLITFGDGPLPDLDVITSALLGTRANLQRAILDARALRRYVSVSFSALYTPYCFHPNFFIVKLNTTIMKETKK